MYEPHTDRSNGCTVCTRYQSMVSNASRVRRDGSTPGVGISLQEFAAWVQRTPLRCEYCHIPEHLIQFLGLRTQVDQPLSRLGIDRLDGTAPYRAGNIVMCCFACNKAKSNTFDAAEMAGIGAAVARVWASRLLDAGVSWERPGDRPVTVV